MHKGGYMKISIDHVCILVKDIREASGFYRDILGLEPTEEFEGLRGTPGASRGVMYRFGDVGLELMAPAGPDSILLNRSLEKRGEGLHHYCFLVDEDEMDTVIRKCQAAGIRLVDNSGEVAKLGEISVWTHPRSTHGTAIQFMTKGALADFRERAY